MNISENLIKVKETLPKNISLVAVSKTKPIEAIQEAYDVGHRIFGENKIQEMVEKYEVLPKDIQWHMIGHLQRNKVKYMAHFVDLIHGVDSFKTLKEIDKQAQKHNRVINCLLQARIAKEETKFGLSFSEIEEILTSDDLQKLSNIKITGLMAMASFTDNKIQIKTEFNSLSSFFNQIHSQYPTLKTLSIGMSGDYQLAIESGSTMVRIGSSIFGAR
jgi:pyridoxal phosphate enzyme (YggS family)